MKRINESSDESSSKRSGNDSIDNEAKFNQLSLYKNGRQLFDHQKQMVEEMSALEMYPREIELEAPTTYARIALRTIHYRAFLSAPVGSGKTAVCLEHLIRAAINVTTMFPSVLVSDLSLTNLVVVPLNLYGQWRTEVELFDFAKFVRPIRFLFWDHAAKVEPERGHSRVIFVKSSIFDDMMDKNCDFVFDRVLIDEADSINIPWRNLATKLKCRYLWYISATIDAANMTSSFFGRRWANAPGYFGNDRAIVNAAGKIAPISWARISFEIKRDVRQENFAQKFNKSNVDLEEHAAKVIGASLEYAMGSPQRIAFLKERIHCMCKAKQNANDRKCNLALAKYVSFNPEKNDHVAIHLKKIKLEYADENVRLDKIAVRTCNIIDTLVANSEGLETLHEKLSHVIDHHTATTGQVKILVVCCKPKMNIDRTRIKSKLRIAILADRQMDIEKILGMYALPQSDANAIDVLILDSCSAKVTGMNLQHTTAIIFADDLATPAMETQAIGRALRTGRPKDMALEIYYTKRDF